MQRRSFLALLGLAGPAAVLAETATPASAATARQQLDRQIGRITRKTCVSHSVLLIDGEVFDVTIARRGWRK